MLPVPFQFSQSSLQDYVDCARRFQLRYLQGQSWPAVQAEPLLEHERHLDRGSRFHRLVQRHQSGIDAAILTPGITDPDLLAWWQSYLAFTPLHALTGRRYPEFTLSTDLAGRRLAATYDLLVIAPGDRAWIIDWKTIRKRPSPPWFRERLQSRVYPYVLARAGQRLFGTALPPAQIRMIYWIAGAPTDPVILDYSDDQFQADGRFLAALLEEITQRSARTASTSANPSIWTLTDDSTKCLFCEYRSLCDRGTIAGTVEEWETGSFEPSQMLGLADVDAVGF